jgi:hypothetical protein
MQGANGPILTRKEKILKCYRAFMQTDCGRGLTMFAQFCITFISVIIFFSINYIIGRITCNENSSAAYKGDPAIACMLIYSFIEFVIVVVILIFIWVLAKLCECALISYKQFYLSYEVIP